MNNLRIYTKTGDTGQTTLIGGKRVPKYHIRIEAYGTVDELNSFLGVIRDQDIDSHYKKVLLNIQERLFIAESLLAKDESDVEVPLPCLQEDDILFLEKEIDAMEKDLPKLQSFILPGGHLPSSHTHVARCVCRRAERIIILLSEQLPVQQLLIRYFNRLSDYLFVLARKLAMDAGINDTHWKAKACEE